jgi:DNA-binding response OmpR family regulator/HPt (histidine-containing phosphotransfer) domain-containing protein
LAPQRLLLVDDDALLRRMVSRTLRHAGFEVVEAGDGEQGLVQFAAQPSDLVLLDLEMPGIGGHEVCARLRSTVCGAQVPILILSGRDDAESMAQARLLGATDFIRKPIDWQALAARVHAALSGPTGELDGRVLLASAHPQHGAAIAAALRDAGATVSVAEDARSALESALQNDFDLVLIDTGLPLIDGIDVPRMLRACGHRRPIVALTRSASDGCANSDAALPLAVDSQRLRRVVSQYLAVGAASCAKSLEPAYREELARHSVSFRAALPAQLEAMRRELKAARWPVLRSLAHTLKGTAGSFGLDSVGELAGTIEAELRAARTDHLATLFDALFSASEKALAQTPKIER